MFSAAMVLLEKSAGTLQALRTTPLTANAYILSKAMTLTCFALLESVIVYAIAFFGVPLNPAPLVIGVFFLGMIYTLIGLGQVASYDSVTMFLFPGAVLVALLLELPMFHVIAGPLPLWYLIPTHGTLLLMLGATETLELWQWAYAIIVPLVSILLAFLWAKRRFARFIGLQEG
jgi:fluoroquinolone transport system permease protein